MIPRVIIGITGASGAIIGIRVVELLIQQGMEVHLIISHSAEKTIQSETVWTISKIKDLPLTLHDPDNLSSKIASGSYQTNGMIIAPCSIKTLSAVANSYSSNLISRAADVCLKEGRPVILAVRESPLHVGHLHLMKQAARAGAVIAPPIPAFYAMPHSIDEMVTHLAGRLIMRLGIPNPFYPEWKGIE